MTDEHTDGTVFADATQVAGEAMIEMEGVYKHFGDFRALADINLKIARTEVVVVIGPSGSTRGPDVCGSHYDVFGRDACR